MVKIKTCVETVMELHFVNTINLKHNVKNVVVQVFVNTE
jgi:hypothetical protein